MRLLNLWVNMLDLIKKKIRGRKVDLISLVKRVWQKGGPPLIRGLIYRFLSSSKLGFPFFLGRGCCIYNSGFFTAGKNVYIGDYSYLDFLCSEGVIFGDNVTIREFAWCQLTSSMANPGVSIFIGENTYIGPRVILGAAAPLLIGRNCQIGANVSFVAENHNFESGLDIVSQGVSRVGIKVEDDCWIGNNVIVLDGVTIGEGCVIGAGSIVTKDIPSKSVAFGNPCKVKRSR